MSIESFGVNTKDEIWVVSELFHPETISTGYIMTEIAKSLVNDYNVSVVCGPEFYEEKINKIEVEKLPNIEIYRIKFKGYNKNNFITRIIGNFRVSYKMLQLMKKRIPKEARILMVTNPIILLVLTSLTIKKRKWKISVLVHDVFPENLIVSGLLKSKNSFVFRIIKQLFNKTFKKMDKIIVLGRDMKKVFEDKIGNKEEISVIENWADTLNISSHPMQDKVNKKLLFAGNLGRLQGIEVLLNALKKTEGNSYTFTFIGSGALEEYISDFMKKQKTNHIEQYGWISREEQDEFMSDANVGVVTLKKGMHGLGVPSKFYNLLAAGKPILYIGDINSELYLVLQENEIGWFAEAGNLVDISEKLILISNTSNVELNRKSQNARDLAVNKYSKEIILNKFNDLFKN